MAGKPLRLSEGEISASQFDQRLGFEFRLRLTAKIMIATAMPTTVMATR
jgi:hypothetical protein